MSAIPARPLGALLRAAPATAPGDAVELLASALAPFGGSDLVLYLLDYQQVVLQPVPDKLPHVEVPAPLEVAATMAGRALLTQSPITARREEGLRVWVPVTERSERVGVLAVTLHPAPADPLTDERIVLCQEFGLLAAHIVGTAARYTDIYELRRRARPMTLPATMQWGQLPPLSLRTPIVVSAGLLEPAYDVGGDAFDHALNGHWADLAIFDVMGHGVRSSTVSGLTLGSYRHDRREGQPLEVIHTRLDRLLLDQYGGEVFSTGQLARLDCRSGELTWTNAGHPLPLLLRQHRIVGALQCPPALPFGLGDDPPTVASTVLEPGDSVLFYTDGVIDSTGLNGEPFGLDRLGDMLAREAASGLPPEEILRRVIAAVIAHDEKGLRDDASLLLVHWPGRATVQ